MATYEDKTTEDAPHKSVTDIKESSEWFLKNVYHNMPNWLQAFGNYIYELASKYQILSDFSISFAVFFTLPFILFLFWSIISLVATIIMWAVAYTAINGLTIGLGILILIPIFLIATISAATVTAIVTSGRLTLLAGILRSKQLLLPEHRFHKFHQLQQQYNRQLRIQQQQQQQKILQRQQQQQQQKRRRLADYRNNNNEYNYQLRVRRNVSVEGSVHHHHHHNNNNNYYHNDDVNDEWLKKLKIYFKNILQLPFALYYTFRSLASGFVLVTIGLYMIYMFYEHFFT
ncbi:hypothetical protein Glove_326g52 [Diversispora epigaea]|uniref:Uncharacterized protein n=1 Tax=Diversispora epigaea TaxID=1348612 RepID=A0A397HU70_9GLOM|nr:hypothetical protein Glove_326g52 [Diversispora epigaea]